ncbi:Uncharacterised protein [Legionella steigerwaltii]|uniref:Uncharacterized protein n=1 Tax=Legionella steigerwaltii TaxID=460 RepID=A0A378LA21_9GAMM|nr:hypothetical protein [Legionella steigerwaltii]KTD71519.1 hypothetical protein Lstg_2928 [Legionella steigerwaltii]STY23547.1 Uncharacterised protein [Legionella steigerwaltii]
MNHEPHELVHRDESSSKSKEKDEVEERVVLIHTIKHGLHDIVHGDESESEEVDKDKDVGDKSQGDEDEDEQGTTIARI